MEIIVIVKEHSLIQPVPNVKIIIKYGMLPIKLVKLVNQMNALM